jgi:hypothetical protein
MQHKVEDLQFFLFAQLDMSVGTNPHRWLRVMRQLQLLVNLQNLQLQRNLHLFHVHPKQQYLLQLALDDHPE